MFIFGVRNINIKGYTMINIREPESMYMYKHFNVCQKSLYLEAFTVHLLNIYKFNVYDNDNDN